MVAGHSYDQNAMLRVIIQWLPKRCQKRPPRRLSLPSAAQVPVPGTQSLIDAA
jgi:hypothetical protein